MSVKIDQAFIQSYIDGAFGLPIAYENSPYTPVAETAYAELRNITNPIEANALKDMDQTTGIFRIIVRYPADSGAIAAKTKADEIMANYGIGSSVSYSSQSATILSTERRTGVVEEGWFVLVVSIGYISFISR